MNGKQGEWDRIFIGGSWVKPDSSARFDVVNPASEEVIGSVPAANSTDIDRAVEAARRAFDASDWRDSTLGDRVAILERLGAQYDRRRDEIATLITSEMGCPITLSRTMQAGSPKLLIEEFIAAAGHLILAERRYSGTGTALVEQEPVGVVAAVIPWNSPHSSAMLKLAPALIAGCTVVLKPAPETALDAFVLAEMLAEAGLPEGVLSVVPADRQHSELLVSHPGVDKVAFTGSTAAGRRIAEICGRDLRRVTLELGGKSAAIVLEDADLDLTVDSLRSAALRNSGQVCTLKTRVLVPDFMQQDLVARLEAMMDSMPVGDPLDEDTEIGPLVTARQRDRVNEYAKIGVEEGANLVTGGVRDGADRGFYVNKTLFADVDNDMRIAQEEIFGPVVCVIPYADEPDAVAKANHSAYGLSGAVYSQDHARAVAVARKLRTGAVEINGAAPGMSAPFGGVKASGIGREMGIEGLRAYLEPKSIGIRPTELAEFGGLGDSPAAS